MMKTYHPTAVYFSPTGGSKAGALAIARQFGEVVEELDVTIRGEVPPTQAFTDEDLVVFGASVYYGRMYEGLAQRLQGLKGNNTPCVITATYGNRHYDDGLLELLNLVVAQGFLPIGGAALVGEHTYGEIQKGRPDATDLEQDVAFAKDVQKKLQAGDFAAPKVPGNYPYKDLEQSKHSVKFMPLTGSTCTKCGICANTCPEKAINPKDCVTIDGELCISCFRCLKTCPEKAKNMNEPQYLGFAKMFSQKLALKRENEYFL